MLASRLAIPTSRNQYFSKLQCSIQEGRTEKLDRRPLCAWPGEPTLMFLVGEHTLQHWCLILHMLTRWLVLWIKVWVLVFPLSFFFHSFRSFVGQAFFTHPCLTFVGLAWCPKDNMGVLHILKLLTLCLSLSTDSVSPFLRCHWITSKHQPTCKLRHGLVALKLQFSLFTALHMADFGANRRVVCGLGLAPGAQFCLLTALDLGSNLSVAEFLVYRVWPARPVFPPILWLSTALVMAFCFLSIYFITVCNIKCANGGIIMYIN